MAIFRFFLGNIGQENVFYDILQRKNTFFPKGLTYGFGPKMTIFPKIFLRQYRPGKFLLRYSRTKKSFQGYKKKQEVEKVEKLTFFQRV